MKKILLVAMSIVLAFVFFIGLFSIFLHIWNYMNRNNIDYQWKLLNTWTTKQKIHAIELLAEKWKISIIPYLIENIDNTDYGTYQDSPKIPETLSCISTFYLQKITWRSYGYTCNSDGSKATKEIQEIIQRWRDWYQNEYPAWLAEQSK